MLKLKDKFKSFFRTKKEIIVNDTKPATINSHKAINDKHNEENIIQNSILNLDTVAHETKKELVKVRIQGYSNVTKDLEFTRGFYDLNSGRIENIQDKTFSNLYEYERITWALSDTSSDIIYGYLYEENRELISSLYILNELNRLKTLGLLKDIIYEIKSRRIIINKNSYNNTNSISFKAFSVCGMVHIEKVLNANEYNLIRV